MTTAVFCCIVPQPQHMTENMTTSGFDHLILWVGLASGAISATLALIHFLSAKHILQFEVSDIAGKCILLGGPLLGLLTITTCSVGLILSQEASFKLLLIIGSLLASAGILVPPLISTPQHYWIIPGAEMAKVNFLVREAKDELLASGRVKPRQLAQPEELIPCIRSILEKKRDPARVKSIEDLEAMANKKIISLGRYGSSYLYATGIEWDLNNNGINP